MAKIKRPDLRLFSIGIFMLLALSTIIARLWVLQVMRGDAYSKRVGGGAQRTIRIPSVRGEIRDRNGIPLVANRASYNVDFYLPDMVRGYRERNGDVPKVTERRSIHGMPKDVPVADIVTIVDTGIIPRLQQLDLAKEYNHERLKRHYEINTLVPYPYVEDIDFRTIARFSEHDVGLPGVDINVKPVRQYIYGAFASHILGYVGMPRDINVLPDVRKFNFYQPDVDGKSQIEKSMDQYLRGEPGVRIIRRGPGSNARQEEEIIPPKPGANVYLTIDARIQYIVETALRHPSIARAAAVVLDPNNGDILAMASVPSFDPNVFIPSIDLKDWNHLLKDPAVPLVNRAVSGFPPGSTFKVVTALAGLAQGIGNDKFSCSGGVGYGGHYFKCWIAGKGNHGQLGLSDALKVSCNAFFYQYGNKASGAAIEKVGGLLGIGHKCEHLGLSDERAGTMPGPQRRKEMTGRSVWTSADTANVSIGQGAVQASPLQMAAVYAMVANGGTAYEPRLVKTVLNADGEPYKNEDGSIAVPDKPFVRLDWHDSLSPEQIEEVRKGLWKVVNQMGGPGGNGTGRNGAVPGSVAAGKTGTAQAVDRGVEENIAWFCSFAPFDKPRYAIAVMVQGGKGGGAVAAPIASNILEQCIALDNGARVNLKPLAPASSPNPFAQIASVSFNGKVTLMGDEADTDTVQNTPPEGVEMAAPEIQVERPEEPDRLPPPPPKARRAPGAAAGQRPATTRPQAQPRRSAVPQEPRERKNFFRKLFDRKPQPASPQRRGGRP